MVTGPVSFSGLVSGLNTQSIINAEMAVYEQPLTNLQTEQSTINTKIADYQAINTQLLALQQSADALADPSAFNEAYSASSSASSVATASVTSGTQTGSLTFAVDQLAVGSTQISAGTVASPNDIVTSGSVLVGSGGAALGITSIGAGTGLAGGDHDITVTQSSSGATVAGTAPLAASTSIDASNDAARRGGERFRPDPHPRLGHLHAQPTGPGRRASLRGQPHRLGQRVRAALDRHGPAGIDGVPAGHRRFGPVGPGPVRRVDGCRHRRGGQRRRDVDHRVRHIRNGPHVGRAELGDGWDRDRRDLRGAQCRLHDGGQPLGR